MTAKSELVVQAGQFWMKMRLSASGTVLWLVLINAAVAVTAFLKDVVQASYLGTTSAADALSLAYFIPDSIGQNVIAAALGVACVPVFSRLHVLANSKRFTVTVQSVAITFLLISVVVTAILYLTRGWLIQQMTGHSSTPLLHMTSVAFLMVLPMMLLAPIAGIGSAVLQGIHRFNVSGCGPLLVNVMYLGTVVAVYVSHVPQNRGLYIIAGGIMAGIACMTLWNWIPLLRTIWTEHGTFSGVVGRALKANRDVMEIWKTFVPYLLILICSQLVFFVERGIAAHCETGTLAGLNYAFRLAQVPIWVYVSAVNVVILPSMSEHAALRQEEELHSEISRALQNIIIVTVPTTLLFYILRTPLVSVLFQRGAFQTSSVHTTAEILAGYSLTIVGQAVLAVGLRFYLAKGKPLVPLLIVAVSSAVNIGADIVLTQLIGPAGIGYGAAIGSAVGTIFIFWLLKFHSGVQVLKGIVEIRRILPANIAALITALLALEIWPHVSAYYGELAKMTYLAAVMVAFVSIYLLVFRVNQRRT